MWGTFYNLSLTAQIIPDGYIASLHIDNLLLVIVSDRIHKYVSTCQNSFHRNFSSHHNKNTRYNHYALLKKSDQNTENYFVQSINELIEL